MAKRKRAHARAFCLRTELELKLRRAIAEEERLLPAAHAARQADGRRAARRQQTAAQIAAGGIEFIVLE